MVFMETRFDSMEDFVLVVTGLSVDKRRRDGGGRVIAFSEIPQSQHTVYGQGRERRRGSRPAVALLVH